MTRFLLADDFTALFPDALVGLVIVSAINNNRDSAESAEILERQVNETAARLPDEDLAALPAIKPWRAAYAQFGVKPSKVRSKTCSARPRPAGCAQSTHWSISTTRSRSPISYPSAARTWIRSRATSS